MDVSNIHYRKFFSSPDFGQLQLTQISLNIKTSIRNLKIKDLRKKHSQSLFYVQFHCFLPVHQLVQIWSCEKL